VLPSHIKEALAKCPRPKMVGVVHAETSTGARSPIEEIGPLVRAAGALFVVDAVTSVAGVDLRVDEWGVDALYSGTQKCLSCPPGLSPITFSPRAMETIKARKHKCQSWYLDMGLIASYWGEDRMYHHTAPISMLYALRESLRLVMEEGLEARFARHLANHHRLREGLEAMGYKFVVAEPYRLPQLNSIWIREGVDDATIRRRLLEEYNIEIGAGLGAFKGKVWRIGLMGASSTPNHVNMLLSALRDLGA
jgi:alanine-glyoxylate transaminase/serine-glyoxylate transaminase/serine-pyruvate transaminase